MSLSTRQQFFAAYRRQLFSLPDSMIYYIAKNPKSSEVYQKLIQSCKYFYIKNPILVLHGLKIDDDGWKTCSNESEYQTLNSTKLVNINIESLSGFKLWIQHRLQINSTNSSCASDLVPFIYQCDANVLDLNNQKLSFRQFMFYFPNVAACFLERVVLTSDADAEIPIEEIVYNLSSLESFMFEHTPESKNVSSDTVKNLLQIPHFKNFKMFALQNVSQKFDIDTFFDYYKKMEPKFDFILDYGDNVLLEEYAQKIEEFITYVLGFPDQKPPLIVFLDQDVANAGALMELHKKF